MSPTPPKHALKFLRWFCREEYLEEMEGDLVELFEQRYQSNPSIARGRFWWDVLKSFRPINFRSIKLNTWTMNLFRNYTRIYFRRFQKEMSHYLVNVLGLALGFAVLFFTLVYVYDEHHVDTFHSKSDRIYRVLEQSEKDDGQIQHFSSTSNTLAEALKDEFPEIEESAKMINSGSGGLRYGETQFNDRNYVFATSSLFNILDFNILKGNPMQEFDGPLAVVLNETTARKLFGDEEPVGKLVDLPGKVENAEVIAVYEDLPGSSSYQFNTVYVSHFDRFPAGYSKWLTSRNSRGMTTWVLFKENASPQSVMDKRQAFLDKYYNDEIRSQHQFYFQSIKEMHLGSNHLEHSGGSIRLAIPYSKDEFVNIILLIGMFVMVIASLNYINLSSVQALKRSVEAGIRKVNGATVGQLRVQLVVETFLTLIIAYVIGLFLVVVLHEQFLNLAGKQISLDQLFTLDILVYQLFAFAIIWVLSALIPALYFSRFSHSVVLKKNAFAGKGDLLRKSFVVVQYGISLCLIIGSLVLYRQLNYVQTKDLGFERAHLLTLDINSDAATKHVKNIVTDLKANANVMNASISSRVPGEWKYIPSVKLYQTRDEKQLLATHYGVDANWLDTYGMKLVAGKNFSGVDHSDTLKLILNEKAVTALGLQDPIGKMLWIERDTVSKMQVIGVVKDFHFESLHESLGPVAITSWNNPVFPIDYFTVKYQGNLQDVVAAIEHVQKKYDPKTPAEINYLNERWERYYQADQNRSYVILVATIISIIVSIFGLFGLVNFTAERKTKEVGVRKVLGASSLSILMVVLRDYLLLLVIALMVAMPIAYLVLNNWLSGFVYRIDLSIWIFVLAFVLVLVISFATVFFRVYHLAKSNPVKSLRYE